MSAIYPNLSKETAAHAERWARTGIGQTRDLPTPWVEFSDRLEKQRDEARAIGEQYIRENGKLAEMVNDQRREIEEKQDAIQSAANQIDKWRNESRANADRCHKSEEQSNQLQREIALKETIIARLISERNAACARLAPNDCYPTPTNDGGLAYQSVSVGDGGPAFPCTGNPAWNHQEGMSLRNWLAGMAMQGYLAGRNCNGAAKEDYMRERTATACFDYADAMLAARKGGA